MAIKSAHWTRKDLERFPRDGNRYEVLDGELLVTPQASLQHQLAGTRIGVALFNYCEAHQVGIAVGPGKVIWKTNELQPDFEVLRAASVHPNRDWDNTPLPILVVEVLSPFAISRRRDLETKRAAYLRLGIPEYWVVDHANRRVHVWSGGRDEQIMTDVLRWHPDPAVPPLEIELGKVFDFGADE